MCRIAAIIDYRSVSSEKISLALCAMRDAMSKGGPDDAGENIFQSGKAQVGFGHRRLSIIDTSAAGHQPMFSAEKDITLIFNGELYNYAEIKEVLIAKGHPFSSHSDTEVLIRAYKEWGMECLQHFRGMFAFLLTDHKNKKLYAVRDRVGVKPLYYYEGNGFTLFASELKSFHQHPDFKKEIDENAAADFFRYGYIPAPLSIFKNTFKLLPGRYMEVNMATKECVTHAYWDAAEIYNRPLQKNISLPDVIDETEKILTEACNYRMVADVPVGIFLSGGYDSTLVTSLLQKNSSTPLKTFCIGFDEQQLNEAPFAKKVSELLGTDHTEYICTYDDALSIIPDLPEIYDEPFGDSSAIPTLLISRLSRKSVKVALSADGGDEVFGGYDKYSSLIKLNRKIGAVPFFIKKAGKQIVKSVQPKNYTSSAFHDRLYRVKKFAGIFAAANMGEQLHQLSMSNADDALHRKGKRATPKNNFNAAALFGNNADNINTMLAVDFMTYLPDDILVKVDRATMSTALEGREPLLDHKIAEWMATIPGEIKFHNGVQKYLLKEIVHRHLPEDLMKRPKAGFSVPLAKWLSNELQDMVNEYLSEDSLKQIPLLDAKHIRERLTRYYSGATQLATEIWHYLVFVMWYKQWMKK